jgi:hypothetical protein
MFRRIHANSANLFHGRSPLFEICNDLILAQSMPSGAVHPNTQSGDQIRLVLCRITASLREGSPAVADFGSAKRRFRKMDRGSQEDPE